MRFRLLVLSILLSISASKGQDAISILFIGNSLTYYNNLPVLVEEEAKEKGFKVKAEMVAKPNYAIIDHLEDGDVQQLIKTAKYDYVIVQQGPSSQPKGRKMLIDDGKKLAQLCNESNSKLCFFMVWPSLNYYSSFDGVIESHKLAAQANEAVLIPVGLVWQQHFKETGKYDYYGLDGFHPSLEGSKVAARVIVETLFN